MDGVRAFWNGHELISKQSKRILCPDWLVEDLPLGVALDGELWMGRNKFEKLMTLLHTSSQDDPWKEVMYVIFDMPHSNETYELRMEALNKIKLPSHAKIVSRIQYQGNDHLLKSLTEIVKEGGEGFMLYKPQSLYIGERTQSLLKAKVIPSAICLLNVG